MKDQILGQTCVLYESLPHSRQIEDKRKAIPKMSLPGRLIRWNEPKRVRGSTKPSFGSDTTTNISHQTLMIAYLPSNGGRDPEIQCWDRKEYPRKFGLAPFSRLTLESVLFLGRPPTPLVRDCRPF